MNAALSPTHDQALREQLKRVLAWEDAHVGFDKAVAAFPKDLRGKRPRGLPYSAWQLLEHLRLAQLDILDFCRDPGYKEKEWPADYWPKKPVPPSDAAWRASIQRVREDRAALEALATDPKLDLFARIPHGSGQTYLREILLAADHAAYHVGELVALRRLLGAWPTR